MELILISDSKLKVMLTPEDMSVYEITCDSIDYDNTETRRVFWNILDEAKHKTGFDAASNKVFIQVYPSKSGGCEMYVTKLNNREYDYDDDSDYDSSNNISLKVKRQNNKQTYHDIYSFDTLNNLLTVCKHLKKLGFQDKSLVYMEKKLPKYYLILSEINNSSLNTYLFINEYGRKQTNLTIYPYIIEHCDCICEKEAVKILSDMI